MANWRITRRKIKEILRLRYEAGRSIRQISSSARISIGAIQKLLEVAAQAQLSWPLPEGMGDALLSLLLYPGSCVGVQGEVPLPDSNQIHHELKRKDITMQLLWEEYGMQHPGRSYSYPRFCALNRNWKARQKRSMRQTHQAGYKCYVDYCGCTVAVHNSQTDKVRVKRRRFSACLAHPTTLMPRQVGGRRRSTSWQAIPGRSISLVAATRSLICDNLKADSE